MPITPQELSNAATLLTQAKAICISVRELFLGRDASTSARLSDVVKRIDDELANVARRLRKPRPIHRTTNPSARRTRCGTIPA